jgi:20S proteasome subunit alpha 7
MAQRLAGYMHLHTMYWWLRPFGTSVLVGSYDNDGPQLYDIDPSGLSFVRCAAAGACARARDGERARRVRASSSSR